MVRMATFDRRSFKADGIISHRPELLHPFASSIDAPALDAPDSLTVVRNVDKPAYVRLPEGKKDVNEEYGDLSIDEWHKKHGKYVE